MSSSQYFSEALILTREHGVQDIDDPNMIRHLNVSKLVDSLDKFRRNVNVTLSSTRSSTIQQNHQRIHAHPYKPITSDYIAVAQMNVPQKKSRLAGLDPEELLKYYRATLSNLNISSTTKKHCTYLTYFAIPGL